LTRSTRAVPAVEGPSASTTAWGPPAVISALTVWRLAAVLPIETISVPRSIPAVSAGAFSNDSATNTRRAPVS
jgi:hypothetical protein